MYNVVTFICSDTGKRVGEGQSELCEWHMVNVTLMNVICLVTRMKGLRTAGCPVRAGCGPVAHRPYSI